MVNNKKDFKYALFTHHFESSNFLKDSVKFFFKPSFIVTLPPSKNYRWLGHELFDIRKFALDNNIIIHSFEDFNDNKIQSLLLRCEIDLIVVIGCSQIIKKEILSLTKFGAVGTHASLLPDLRGPAPINWALINDLKITGNTLMKLSTKLDAGEILDQKDIQISDSDDCMSLYFKVSKTNSSMILKVLFFILFNKKLPPSKKQKFLKSCSKKRTPDDSKINWRSNSRQIFNFIRALSYPYPNAFCFFEKSLVKICNASYILFDHKFPPGYIVGEYEIKQRLQNKIAISCLDGFLIINKININGDIFENSNLIKWAKNNRGKVFN